MSRLCKFCNKVFPNGKSLGGHIRACNKKEKEKNQEDIDYGMEYYCSSSESESKFEFHADDDGDGGGAESNTKESVEPVNLTEHLPQGWSANRKRRRDSPEAMLRLAALNQASEKSSTEDILKYAALNLLLLPSVSDSKQKGIEEKLARYRNRFAHHLGVKKKPMKNNDYAKEKRPSEFVEGHKRTYVCRECGLVFDNFQGLGGHLAAHNRKRLREKVGELDLVDVPHQDSKGKNVIIGTAPAIREYKCNLCEKSFPSGQALGGHKSYHSTASTGYNQSRKALGDKNHHYIAHTEINHSRQALAGHTSHHSAVHTGDDHCEQGYRSYHSTADTGCNDSEQGYKSYRSTADTGFNHSRKAIGEHKSPHNTAHTEINYSGQALGGQKSPHNTEGTELNHSGQALGHKSHHSAVHTEDDHWEQGHKSYYSTADTGYNHSASSREASSGVVSHSNPPSSVEVSHPNRLLGGSVLDLNMAPGEGLWGK